MGNVLGFCVHLVRLVAGWEVRRYIIIVRVAEGVRERKESGERKKGRRVEGGVDDVGIVVDGIAVAIVVAEVNVDVVEILRGAGIGGVSNDGVGSVGVVVVVSGGIDVDGGGVGVDEAASVVGVVVVIGVNAKDVIVVLVVGGGVA